MANSTLTLFTGLHIVGQLTQCVEKRLIVATEFNQYLHGLIVKHGLRSLGSVSHTFKGSGGFSSVVCLSESHIAVHTWPELRYVTLDVYLCNYSRKNEERCRIIFSKISDFFGPGRIEKQEISR